MTFMNAQRNYPNSNTPNIDGVILKELDMRDAFDARNHAAHHVVAV